MKSIVDYVGRPANTIKAWVKTDKFPAVKIDGRWESNTELIDSFQKGRIENFLQGHNQREVVKDE